MRPYRVCLAILVLCSAAGLFEAVGADELSSGDELRALYSDRFAFTDGGMPLVTVEIMSHQDKITLGADSGVVVRPRGHGGAEVSAGNRWTVEVENATPGALREWTVVARLDVVDDAGIDAELSRWLGRGFEPARFEVGTVFGVDGEVIDSREVLIGVDGVSEGKGSARAAKIGKRWKLETSLYTELVERPSGTLVATSNDGAVVRNPSVLWFGASDPDKTIDVEDVVHGGGGSQLDAERTEDRSYWGEVYVTIGRDAKLIAVNSVTADKLLAGLVPSEIFPDAHAEALAAQAIAARTEVLSRIGTRHLADPFLVCSNQHCQVYSGAGKETPRTTRAVAKTRGIVMLREGGGLVDARYSASCGGHSEHNENIWGGDPDPSLRGHLDATDGGASRMGIFDQGVTDNNVSRFLAGGNDDAYCGATKYARNRYRWTKTIDRRALTKLVAKHYAGVGTVRSLEPMERGVSGRINKLRVSGDKGEAIVTGDLHIRRLLGGLRSTLFTVRVNDGAFELTGAGFGHGVGMCQTGAIGRAEAGQSHETILRHYYDGMRTHRLY